MDLLFNSAGPRDPGGRFVGEAAGQMTPGIRAGGAGVAGACGEGLMADPAAARGEAGQYAGPEIDDCPSGSGLHPAP